MSKKIKLPGRKEWNDYPSDKETKARQKIKSEIKNGIEQIKYYCPYCEENRKLYFIVYKEKWSCRMCYKYIEVENEI